MRMGMQAVHQLALAATIITMLFACSVLHVRAVQAATYYVATNGSDSNPGTQSAPFGTIRKGLATIHAGDTLYLRGGTYNEAISSNNQTIPTGTSWSNPVTITSYPGESAILQPSGVGAVLDFNAYNTSYHIQYIIFDRLILDGSNALAVVSLLGNASGFQTHHIRFQNGEIRYSSGCGGGYHIVGPISQPGPTGQGNQVNIQLFGGYNNEFLHSKIHNSWCGYGFYVNGHDHLIDGNDIYDNAGYGIQVYDGSTHCCLDNHIIRNNRFWGNGYVRGFGAIVLAYGSNAQVYNNFIYNNNYGIQVDYGETNAQIYNNTIANNTGFGVSITSSAGGTILKNNIIYGNSTNIDNQGSSTTLSHNYTSDPLFVNASAGDFHLQSSSPAKTASDSGGEVGAYGGGGSSSPSSPPISQIPAPKNIRVLSVAP